LSSTKEGTPGVKKEMPYPLNRRKQQAMRDTPPSGGDRKNLSKGTESECHKRWGFEQTAGKKEEDRRGKKSRGLEVKKERDPELIKLKSDGWIG